MIVMQNLNNRWRKIYYGLGAIKNVVLRAISNIIKERQRNGNFQSLINFIERVDIKM